MRRNLLEWAVLAGSVLALVAVVGVLVVAWATDRGDTAIVEVRAALDEVVETESGWIVPIVVRNVGGGPAAALMIEASASVDGEEETRVLTLDLLPAGAESRLLAAFSREPDGPVRARVIGWSTS